MKFDSIIDAAAYLISGGYWWNQDYGRFERASWYAYLAPLKNGKCRVEWS